ncbi:MAG: UDP-N-acetylmuramoyl-L-alanyl-D-glutamate--2,6-diaminopimelate ligase [Proteobacteria bacterium]|nr:UDP-N-acetylmuramoyl-L-alanyl-D-glutamate--2,6-diaminopimelate ligase [Pseudomonadota bacterium]
MKIEQLLKKISPLEIKGELPVFYNAITDDSRNVNENDIFFAIKGVYKDGHDFIKDIKVKFVAVVERYIEEVDVPQILVKSTKKAFFNALELKYGLNLDKMPFVAVTGTNGKTTFTYLMESILKSAGKNPGIIGTVNYRCGSLVKNATHTTPDMKTLFKIFDEFKKNNCDIVVMEVSSHALKQNRIGELKFDVALFTNLTPEHLDFHHDMEDYYCSKKILFEKHLKRDGLGIVNMDDNYGKRLHMELSDKRNIKGFSFNIKTDYTCALLRMDLKGIELGIWSKEFSDIISSNLKGRFNAYNLCGAYISAKNLGIESEIIKEGLKGVRAIPGRLEEIPNDCGISVFVDYAHTPDALENVLSTIREFAKSRVITVFGCGGDRDKTKRAPMGKVASRYSDIIIVTSDNPRSENPEDIIEDIKKGIDFSKKVIIQPDREKAIKDAIYSARKGDIILIAGKGHENYQIFKDKTIYFSDQEVAKKILEIRQCLAQQEK